ncbi:MAG TPA: carbohydrate kinase, partial [Spirochaetes bacterium]|nr:carbohydrate kinase [Spirochaetota bacterium]
MAKNAESGNRHIVVFDVGKTNKKLVVFDGSLRPVHSVYKVFDEVQRDGISYETVEETSLWLLDNLKEIAARFEVGALSVSVHGAAFACVDADGRLAMPVLSYTHDPGEAFHNEFYGRFGDPAKLHVETATPNMPGLGCMAKGIYFASQRFPEEFAKTTTILGLPQFYGHLLTGNRGAEYTFMATHTYLWDFDRCDYGPLVDAMGIRKRMPPKIQRPWDVLGTVTPEISKRTGISETAVVTLGIHDSNASMIPYLVKASKPFVLNTTGTVCVAMRPAAGVTFTPDEMGKVVYYNHNA